LFWWELWNLMFNECSLYLNLIFLQRFCFSGWFCFDAYVSAFSTWFSQSCSY
jgi:hypothetical protein